MRGTSYMKHFFLSLAKFEHKKMEKKIQSLFTGLIILIIPIALFLPLWQKVGKGGEEATLTFWNLTHVKGGVEVYNSSVFYLGLIAIVTIGIAIFSLISYKSLLKQMLANFIFSFVMVALLLIITYHAFFTGADLFNPRDYGRFGYGGYALIIVLSLNALSNRFIRKEAKDIETQMQSSKKKKK